MLCGMTLVPFVSKRGVLAVAVAVACVLGGVAAHGQRPSGGGPLLIDFTAVTADGKPVTDLNPADVAIKIGGKARTVSSLVLKKIEPAAAPAGAPAEAAGDITPPFVTNEAKASDAAGSTGRSFLIVVDNESLPTAAEAGMKSAIDGLLKGLNSNDRVAFSTAPNDTAQVGFGTGLARVRDAVAAVRGQKQAGEKTGNEILQSKSQSNLTDAEKNTVSAAFCRTSQTLALVNSLLRRLAGGATPTSVIVIAGNLSLPGKETGGASGTCEVLQATYQSIGDTAGEVLANFYVVQGDSGVMGRDQGLDQLAGATGAGQVMRVSGDGFAPRVLAESSSYWVATLAADPSDRPGQAQRLEVKVARDGVTVHSRASAAVPRAAAASTQPQAKSGSASPKEMIATDAKFTDLQLRATAYVSRGQTDKMNVLVFAEPVDPAVKITAMRVGYFDQANKGASTDAPQIATYPITTGPLPVGVGPYRIRVAATDASGKNGAVDVNVNTTLVVAGPVRMGDLMLAGPRPDGKIGPRLVFVGDEEISVMFELYGQLGPDTKIKLGFELAKSDAGAATDTYRPSGITPTNEPDKFQIVGRIPIAELAPGDYVLRGVAQIEGQPEGKVLRTFRKVAK